MFNLLFRAFTRVQITDTSYFFFFSLDFAFGRCVSRDDDSDDDFYRFPDFSAEEEGLLEDEVSRLYDNGFVWTDDYTQCVLQTALAAIRDQ